MATVSEPTLEANKAIVRRFVQEVLVGGSVAAVDELVADDFVPHTWPSDPNGKAALKAAIERVAAGLSDVTMTIDDLVAEGDEVVARLTASATQVGPFMGLQPSGKSYAIGEIHIFRIERGRIVEHWHQADMLGIMRQLGALPAPAKAPGGDAASSKT
jgi:steroid delta-isomerase-like uncharacterized protein